MGFRFVSLGSKVAYTGERFKGCTCLTINGHRFSVPTTSKTCTPQVSLTAPGRLEELIRIPLQEAVTFYGLRVQQAVSAVCHILTQNQRA